MADDRSVLLTGGGGMFLALQLFTLLSLLTAFNGGSGGGHLFSPVEVVVEFNVMVEGGGSHDEVDSEDDVEAQSLPHDDSTLDSVSVEPVLPIDIVLPICIPMAFIGFESVKINFNQYVNKFIYFILFYFIFFC